MEENLMLLKESAVSYLDRFEGELPALVLELRSANAARIGALGDVTEGAHWLLQARQALRGPDGDAQDRLSDALDAMHGAIKNMDYTLIADIIEYELMELAAEWRNAIEG